MLPFLLLCISTEHTHSLSWVDTACTCTCSGAGKDVRTLETYFVLCTCALGLKDFFSTVKMCSHEIWVNHDWQRLLVHNWTRFGLGMFNSGWSSWVATDTGSQLRPVICNWAQVTTDPKISRMKLSKQAILYRAITSPWERPNRDSSLDWCPPNVGHV